MRHILWTVGVCGFLFAMAVGNDRLEKTISACEAMGGVYLKRDQTCVKKDAIIKDKV